MTKAPKTHRPYACGNRLALPAGGKKPWAARHNLYMAKPQPADNPDIPVVNQAVDKYLENLGLGSREIDAIPVSHLGDVACEAALRLAALWEPKGFKLGSPDILVTSLAPVHEDESFEGMFFASLVLQAGHAGYLFQSFHTEVKGGANPRLELVVDERLLEVGDILVFDPTTPHMAAPLDPQGGDMLVMLQREIYVPDQETYERLLEALPPCANRNQPLPMLW